MGTNGKLKNFHVFPHSAHQAELDKHQGHNIGLDTKFPFQGRLTYDLHDKHWIPHIEINKSFKMQSRQKK